MENEFPPNSHAQKEARPARVVERAPEKKEVARVTRGKTIQRKKPLGRRFVETFTGDSSKGVFEYVLLDVMVPGFKDIVADASTTAIERMLFGDAVRSSARRRTVGGRGHTEYRKMSGGSRDRDRDRRPSRRESGPSDHNEIVVESRVEADTVLDSLFELLSKYGVATMRDLLSLVGEAHSFTDEDWGWTDLRGARVHRVREGYLIDLPRPEPLD